MTRLQQDLDDLDRMVDGNAPKDKTRSHIRLISREVAALEADYARLAEAHSKLQATHSELEAQHTALKDGKRKAGWDALQKQADDYERIVRSKDLDYGA